MYLADLMEKSEAGQFIVLSYLQQHSTSSLKDVMSETGFSKATLTKYISLINDKAVDHMQPYPSSFRTKRSVCPSVLIPKVATFADSFWAMLSNTRF